MEQYEIDREELLKDQRVLEEIHRHLWLESERLGYDIGFEKAKEDWLKNFSRAWMKYYLPNAQARLEAVKKGRAASKSSAADSGKSRRRAKSYM